MGERLRYYSRCYDDQRAFVSRSREPETIVTCVLTELLELMIFNLYFRNLRQRKSENILIYVTRRVCVFLG